MAIYDFRDFDDHDLSGRFPERPDIVGVHEWQRLIASLRDVVSYAATPEGRTRVARAFGLFLRATSALSPSTSQPRVFVSHQRADWREAERVAWHATEVSFEYWLDVHDPSLSFVNRANLTPQIRAVLIAAIVEMGLLNCSHVVALHTTNSTASRWIPYEFGRAKQRVLVSSTAASWFQTGLGPDPTGDYLSLAFCAATEGDLEQWFAKQPGARSAAPNTLWPKTTTPRPLPN